MVPLFTILSKLLPAVLVELTPVNNRNSDEVGNNSVIPKPINIFLSVFIKEPQRRSKSQS